MLDVRGVSPVCDYFVLATGSSPRQMRTVAEQIAELAEQSGWAPIAKPGLESETWILLDCVDVVIHIFEDQARRFYDLDGLWGDARSVDWAAKA